MLGYSKCPTARRNKSGYRETKVDISSAHAGNTGPENIYGTEGGCGCCNKDMACGRAGACGVLKQTVLVGPYSSR